MARGLCETSRFTGSFHAAPRGGRRARLARITCPASRDVIEKLTNAPHLVSTNLLGPSLVDKLSLLDAGDIASLVVLRGSQTATLKMRLGSMIDPSALIAAPPAGQLLDRNDLG